MYFTQEDYRKIEAYLKSKAARDTSFDSATTPLQGNETIVLVQGGKNVNTTVSDIVSQFFALGVSDFINVTDKYGISYNTLDEAIRVIPWRSRKVGQVITFLNEQGEWHLYQYQGESILTWNNTTLWVDLLESRIVNSILPDQEDLTMTEPDADGNSYMHFKDKDYSIDDFSGLGRVYLRKNLQTLTDPNTGETRLINYLTQTMVGKENVIYHIQYDYNLNGQTIIIPEGCVLLFEGGSISNGTITGQNTKIVSNGCKIFESSIYLSGKYLSQLNPKMFGVALEDDGHNYDKLLLMYNIANAIKVEVDWSDYSDQSITLTTLGTTSIPLTKNNDFCGVEFKVKNNSNALTLFQINGSDFQSFTTSNDVIKNCLNGLDYSTIPEIGVGTGLSLLKIKDSTTWTIRVDGGTSTPQYRYDLILINDGVAYNLPIYNYDNGTPEFEYVKVEANATIIKNLSITRLSGSTYITRPLVITRLNNVLLENVNLKTATVDGLTNDFGFTISDCSNVTLLNLTINGIYDNSGFGYGLFLTNLYNLVMNRVNTSNYNWGIMGCNYLNTATIYNSNINRFDLHLYGRDFLFINCQFKQKYNQFSNVYGSIVFDTCQFINCTPIIYEGSYNAWTGHDVIFKNCSFKGINYLINLYKLNDTVQDRSELAQKCLPNINIENCIIINLTTSITIFNVPSGNMPIIGYIDHIYINGFKLVEQDLSTIQSLRVSSNILHTLNAIKVTANNVSLLEDSDDKIIEESIKYRPKGGFYFGTMYKEGDMNTVEISNSRLALPANANTDFNCIIRNSTISNIRYETSSNSHIFEDCNIYLTDIDDTFYSLRSNSIYTGCKFFKKNNTKEVRLYSNGEYRFYKCTKEVPGKAFLTGAKPASYELRGLIGVKKGANTYYILDDYNFKEGTSSERPILTSYYLAQYFDTTLNAPIMWDGTKWINEDGTLTSKVIIV